MLLWSQKIGVGTDENESRKDPEKETSLLSPLVIHLLKGEDLLSEWTIEGKRQMRN